ncbi:MAG: response regulator transcription factor [Flavobacteriales bacterium]|mgnify:CR=1 FL=1|nr:response regulator transcription factor [Flavobacteriales bacterium]MCC6939623.1 response regulator transcription factor [Flavobacteriales bacterium]
MLKVAVFDDNRDRREGLSLLIGTAPDMECVGAFEDCREVLRHMAEVEPDVVLMDIDMPHVNGIEGVEQIKKQFPKVRVLMQTVFEDDDKVFASILAGADGYLLKQSTPTRVLQGIHEVMEGGAPMTPTIARKVLSFFNKKGRITGKDSDFDLSVRELEILRLLVDGLTYKKIAERCSLSYATVNSHVTRIYSKLQVRSVASAVSLALREGLV